MGEGKCGEWLASWVQILSKFCRALVQWWWKWIKLPFQIICTGVLISILAIIRDIGGGSVVKDGGCGCLLEAKNACHFVVCVLMLLHRKLRICILVYDSLIAFCKKICGDGGYVL